MDKSLVVLIIGLCVPLSTLIVGITVVVIKVLNNRTTPQSGTTLTDLHSLFVEHDKQVLLKLSNIFGHTKSLHDFKNNIPRIMADYDKSITNAFHDFKENSDSVTEFLIKFQNWAEINIQKINKNNS